VFQVGIQELQRIEFNPGITRVGIVSFIISDLVFRKALRTLSALKHPARYSHKSAFSQETE